MKPPSGLVIRITTTSRKKILQQSICCHQNFSGRNMAYTRYTSSPAQMTSMMIGPEFIYASTYSLAENHVSDRNRKKCYGYSKENCVLHFIHSDHSSSGCANGSHKQSSGSSGV